MEARDARLLQPLIERVGAEAFREAEEHAWRIGVDDLVLPRYPSGTISRVDDTIHGLADYVWLGVLLPEPERIQLGFALYRTLPSIDVLLYATRYAREASASNRALFWDEYRELLSQEDDRLSRFIEDSLTADCFYEEPLFAESAWRAMTEPPLPRRGLERLLTQAGPVSWPLKAPLYESLLSDESWHPWLLQSLARSYADIGGQIEASPALVLLNRLRVPEQDQLVRDLKDRLLRSVSSVVDANPD